MSSSNPSLIPLCVPPWDQRDALQEGAKYSKEIGFYISSNEYLPNFDHWLPRRYKPSFVKRGVILMPDMLPITSWGQNIREVFGQDTWDRMRKHSYMAAGFRCEICGANGRLESHELFYLENETCKQKLIKLMALCELCHKAHHLGFAKSMNMLPQVHNHLIAVNGWTEKELEYYLEDAYETWLQRKDWPWELDVSPLQKSGYFSV